MRDGARSSIVIADHELLQCTCFQNATIVKNILKRFTFAVATLVALPLIVITRISQAAGGGEGVFQGCSQLLSLVPARLGVYLRAAFYTWVCNRVDREVAIGFLTLFSHTDTDLGKHVYVGAQCNIGSCSIGRDCLLGSGVHVLSGKHQHDFSDSERPIRLQGGRYEKIQIGDNCWIGNHATVLADVGEHSIVAAGSVVADKVPPRSIVAGNPARILKSR